MGKYFALLPALAIVLVVSGCTTGGLSITDFQAGIENILIGGKYMKCILSGPDISGVSSLQCYAEDFSGGVSMTQHSTSSDAQVLLNALKHFEDMPELNRSYVYSEVTVSDENINKLTIIEPGSEIFITYFWAHDKFVFSVSSEDEEITQSITEKIIDIYES